MVSVAVEVTVVVVRRHRPNGCDGDIDDDMMVRRRRRRYMIGKGPDDGDVIPGKVPVDDGDLNQ